MRKFFLLTVGALTTIALAVIRYHINAIEFQHNQVKYEQVLVVKKGFYKNCSLLVQDDAEDGFKGIVKCPEQDRVVFDKTIKDKDLF